MPFLQYSGPRATFPTLRRNLRDGDVIEVDDQTAKSLRALGTFTSTTTNPVVVNRRRQAKFNKLEIVKPGSTITTKPLAVLVDPTPPVDPPSSLLSS